MTFMAPPTAAAWPQKAVTMSAERGELSVRLMAAGLFSPQIYAFGAGSDKQTHFLRRIRFTFNMLEKQSKDMSRSIKPGFCFSVQLRVT